MSLQKSPYDCPICGRRWPVPSLAAFCCSDLADLSEPMTPDTTPTPATDPTTAHDEAS